MRYRGFHMEAITHITITPLTEDNHLTQVEALYEEARLNYRLLFGRPIKWVEKEFCYGKLTRRVAYFRPGQIFALDLWERNQYGTTAWAVYVLQAAGPTELAVKVPQVTPAAKVLLEAIGAARAKEALRLLREIESRTDPTSVSPNRFLLTDFRLKCFSQKRIRRAAGDSRTSV
jgi:hypothetical protein